MDYYNYEPPKKNANNRSSLVTALVIALVIMIVVNVVTIVLVTNGIKSGLNDDINASLQSMEDELNGKIDDAVADRLTTTIADQVKDNLVDDITNTSYEQLMEQMTEEILENYKRQYYLPDDYYGIGVIVAEEVPSIMELTASAVSNNGSTVSSASSGVILSKDGYLVTNAHCVTFTDNINNRGWVVGTETKEYSAIKANFRGSNVKYDMQIIAYDIDKDLAILKMISPPDKLTPVRFADSSLLSMGEEVAVIGNAGGLGISITTGVLSSDERIYGDVKIIQTDSAINPGNSGGAVLNIYGELIGVVSFKIVSSEASEGLGFAIASSSVMDYISAIETEKGITINYTQPTY